MTISLVAEIDGQVVGHIAFSPIVISDGTTDWYGMGPVSVLPDHQKQGIGKALVNEGIPQEVFLVLPFIEKIPKGIVKFHEAFKAES